MKKAKSNLERKFKQNDIQDDGSKGERTSNS